MKTQFLFPRQAIPKIVFALHSHYTGDTPYRVWFDLENSLTPWKRPFFKIPFSRNSISSVWNTNFFPDKVYQFFFCFTLSFHWWYCVPNLVLIWTTPCPDEKELFFKFSKIRTSRNSQNSVLKHNFFPGQAIPRILFALHSHYTVDNQYGVWFDLDNSLTRWKWIFFKVRMKTLFFLGKLDQQLFCVAISLHWW